ncbi:tRNA uridine-5-carboxymethylaminomethyl(34) synthesis GTPase MnmE [Candidatus Kirkpatrickella diaphorinae]|uniref:tRNA modification GTPase MnmE n=1 Tax=Candidatus Kirkpatrickella diaphorinae TaxID=2984322 RepID=A0ABY6GHP3_9PROT|nr:tRNA uridine-5-carboxymethylaminomethyl(34) synthesis GTPase MnmE [Candidatus Kirkpatrickella diaphorinae]UYH51037.1 tRNA uridine-5-carboxymethylaminomethyl(34) synthesis GTPase MnmE [Candidatus Kirkpatrickella diaphorinae]
MTVSTTTPPENATIFALATGLGGAIAVMRISGPRSRAILQNLCSGALPAPRRASLRRLRHQSDILDEAVVLWLPGPHSYTGEDGAELHLHAGPAVIDAVSEALVAHGARPAEPGEFTRRAVLHQRLDLIQAEAIADLVAAESQMQRQQALAQSEGALSRLYDGWREKLSHLLARQEALIDFPDEVGEAATTAHIESHMDALLEEMEAHLGNHRGEIVQRGLTVVIAGAPNVGKSSLLNTLAGYDAAIVTARAGTTRDVVAVEWLFEGMKLRLLDTAGLRETEDEIEAEGIKRALFHVKHADVVLHLYEGSPPEKIADDAVMIRTKCDLDAEPRRDLAISTLTGQSIDTLLSLLATRIKKLKDVSTTPLTRARHRAGIEEARAYLMEARQTPFPELRGESLRLAMRALGRITGQINVESLLDVIFGQFCIGK